MPCRGLRIINFKACDWSIWENTVWWLVESELSLVPRADHALTQTRTAEKTGCQPDIWWLLVRVANGSTSTILFERILRPMYLTLEIQEVCHRATGQNWASSLINRVLARALVGLERCRQIWALMFNACNIVTMLLIPLFCIEHKNCWLLSYCLVGTDPFARSAHGSLVPTWVTFVFSCQPWNFWQW